MGPNPDQWAALLILALAGSAYAARRRGWFNWGSSRTLPKAPRLLRRLMTVGGIYYWPGPLVIPPGSTRSDDWIASTGFRSRYLALSDNGDWVAVWMRPRRQLFFFLVVIPLVLALNALIFSVMLSWVIGPQALAIVPAIFAIFFAIAAVLNFFYYLPPTHSVAFFDKHILVETPHIRPQSFAKRWRYWLGLPSVIHFRRAEVSQFSTVSLKERVNDREITKWAVMLNQGPAMFPVIYHYNEITAIETMTALNAARNQDLSPPPAAPLPIGQADRHGSDRGL